MFFESESVQFFLLWMRLEVNYTPFDPFHRRILYVCSTKSKGKRYEKDINHWDYEFAYRFMPPSTGMEIGVGRKL